MPRSNNKIENAVMAGKSVYPRKPVRRDPKEFVALNRASTQLHRGLVSPPTDSPQFTQFLGRCRRSDSACFFTRRVEDRRIVSSIKLRQIFMGGSRNAF